MRRLTGWSWGLQRGYGLGLDDVARYLWGRDTEPATIHVDYSPEHEPLTFDMRNGEPILEYRRPTPRQLANLERLRASQPYRGKLPDGWVLTYEETWCERLRPREAGSTR